ncbi:MAG: M10 family metallopeptidase, partial [Holosporales bacterium]
MTLGSENTAAPETSNNDVLNTGTGGNEHAVLCPCNSCAEKRTSNLDPLLADDANNAVAPLEHLTAFNNGGVTGVSGSVTSSILDGLRSGYKWNSSSVLTYSFYESSVFGGAYYNTESPVETSEAVKTNMRNIFTWLENVINVDFQEVAEVNTSTYGQIRVMNSSSPSYAYAYLPTGSHPATGDIHLNTSYDRTGDTNGFQHGAGSHGYMSLIHELGHALGLKHPHETPNAMDGAVNNTSNTVMTYNFTGSSAGTFMPYDIKVLQGFYGAKSFNAGDSTYAFSRVDSFTVGGASLLTTGSLSTKQTIWDSGGTDTLDFSGLASNSSGYVFDLKQGGFLTTQAAYNAISYSGGTTHTFGTAIAYDVIIENVISSGSNDYIIGNSAANRFGGYTT